MTMPGHAKRFLLPAAVGLFLISARAVARHRGPRAGPRAKRLAEQWQQRSRGILHSASDAIISTDENQTILQANPAAAAMFGTSVDAMQGMPLDRYIPRDLRALGEQQTVGHFGDTGLSLRMVGRRATDYAVTGMRASGEQFPLEGSISSLNEGRQQIVTIILRDITERKQVQQQLEQSYSQLRKLSAALQTIREEERTYIARELHDDLGQLLATLRLDLTLLQQQTLPSPATQQALRSMDALIVTAITSLRRIASNLRPRALDEGGLYFALQSLRQEFIQRYAIEYDMLADEADLALDDAHSTAIYRIVQEALTNIARHAQARHVTVALHRLDSTLAMSIQDDGLGLMDNDLEKSASFGLLGMRERVWGLHGEISIGPNSGASPGMRIDIVLPLPPRTAL